MGDLGDRHPVYSEMRLEEAWSVLWPFTDRQFPEAAQQRDQFLDETAATDLLRRFYFFRIASITVSDRFEDIEGVLLDRFRRLLSAAFGAQWTMATMAVGSQSGTKIFLGFLADGTFDGERSVFERALTGLLPGCECRFEQFLSTNDLASEKPYRGLVVGTPIVSDDERVHRFRMAEILRAMHGQEYFMLVVARPVEPGVLIDRLKAL